MNAGHEGRSARRRAEARGWLGFEHHEEPIASVAEFRARLLKSLMLMSAVLAVSLALGVAGYHWIVGIPRLVDCVYSASMIMGGMGPVGDDPATDAGKWFASFYALYSGVVLLASVGLLLSPVLHRLMHRFHVETDA
jgi:hypothetical protein